MQSNQGLCCLLTESLNTTESSKCPDEILCMRRMNLNLLILRMLEDTFSLDRSDKKCLSKEHSNEYLEDWFYHIIKNTVIQTN